MLKDTLLMKAYRGEKTSRAPLWLMRQAGRYLPEYRAIRAKHKMLEVIRTPELAAEVTLQPIRRFGFDGSIIFADILTPLIGMGIELDFVEGEGPKIFNPIEAPSDVARLRVPTPEENTGYTLKAIKLVTADLTPRGVPLLGFSGAPFTLSSYMIADKGNREISATLRFMREEPKAWNALQEKLIPLVSDYLVAQVGAGCSAVQIFDSWAGHLSPSEFVANLVPALKEIVTRVKAKVNVPVIYFATGVTGLMEHFHLIGADAFGVDWRVSLTTASTLLGKQYPLQGNLDPTLLTGSWDPIEREMKRILSEGRALKGYVANLGHGILPHTPIENVERLVAMVKES